MKLGKYILGLAVVLATGLTSCNTDNIGAIYEPTAKNITFMLPESSSLTKANNYTVPVTLSRSIIGEAYTANVVIAEAYCITANGEKQDAKDNMKLANPQAVFDIGDSFATVNVEFVNMYPGSKYYCTLVLSDADLKTASEIGSQIPSSSVSVMCDFDWENIGNGHYISEEWWEEEFDVPIERAKGTNLYRMIGLFQEGYDIEFTIDGDKVYVPKQGSWVHSSYGVVSLQGWAGENNYAGPYDAATKTCTMALQHTVSAGSFGVFVDYLVMP